MRVFLSIVLVLILVLLGTPLVVGHADMDPCPACMRDGLPLGWAMCLAILSSFLLVISLTSRGVPVGPSFIRLLLLPSGRDRPPRPA